MVFDVLHEWAKNYVKNVSSNKNLQINPVHVFLSGSGRTGKSHLVKTIYQAISKELLYHSKEPWGEWPMFHSKELCGEWTSGLKCWN